MEWLLSPIDASRLHSVGMAVSWHARIMVFCWVVIAPAAVLAARYLKVMPGQDWPRVLDNPTWWRIHLKGQTAVAVLSVLGFLLIIGTAIGGTVHGFMGFIVLAGMALQVVSGLARGTKGGPTAPAPDGSERGDHFDMTRRRIVFEYLHKTLGHLVLLLATFTVLLGLWHVNAPRWMWLVIGLWWGVLLVAAIMAQRRGMAMDTYQAIWGPDPGLPGNTRTPIGWGIRRIDERNGNVRTD